jgi:anti-sigma B factor antagonist
MKATCRSVNEVQIVDLSGKITIAEGAIELRRLIDDLLESGRSKILLSLDKVGFVDSAGLGEVVACYKRALEKGGTIKILRPSGKVADLLSLTRITEIFEIYQDEGEAIASF